MTFREYPAGKDYEESLRILLILNILMNVSESEGIFDLRIIPDFGTGTEGGWVPLTYYEGRGDPPP